MRAEIARHALDRAPLSIIFDDSTLLVNLSYFFMRDRNLVDGENRRWEDVPVVHPESFTREFAEWCLEHGVKGKYSIVPCPAALGRIDEGLPMFSRAQQEDWLAMCRELITRNFDITPEMITHTVVVDPDTCGRCPRASGSSTNGRLCQWTRKSGSSAISRGPARSWSMSACRPRA